MKNSLILSKPTGPGTNEKRKIPIVLFFVVNIVFTFAYYYLVDPANNVLVISQILAVFARSEPLRDSHIFEDSAKVLEKLGELSKRSERLSRKLESIEKKNLTYVKESINALTNRLHDRISELKVKQMNLNVVLKQIELSTISVTSIYLNVTRDLKLQAALVNSFEDDFGHFKRETLTSSLKCSNDLKSIHQKRITDLKGFGTCKSKLFGLEQTLNETRSVRTESDIQNSDDSFYQRVTKKLVQNIVTDMFEREKEMLISFMKTDTALQGSERQELGIAAKYRPDYALLTSGSSLVFNMTSSTFSDSKSSRLFNSNVFGFNYGMNEATEALQENYSPGDCWPMKVNYCCLKK